MALAFGGVYVYAHPFMLGVRLPKYGARPQFLRPGKNPKG